MSTEQTATDHADSMSFEESLDQYSDMLTGGDDDSQQAGGEEEVIDEGSPEDGNEEKAVDDAGQQPEETNPDEAQSFELSKDLSLKVGDEVTAEHLKQLERSFLREQDYTQKTQELAQVREEADQVIQARDHITKDPRALREYFTDDHIMQAYSPHELLSRGLAMNKVPPQVWNQFLEEFHENHGQGAANPNWKADPQSPQVGQLQTEIKTLKSKLSNFEQSQVTQAAEAEKQKAIKELDGEIKGVLDTGKFPGITREDILAKLAVDQTNRTVEQIAKAMHDDFAKRYQAYGDGLRQKQKRKVQKPSGSSVPIMPKMPKNFEEADELLDTLNQHGKI